MKLRRRIALCAAVLIGALGTARAMDTLPYQGSLYFNGGPADGQVEMRFTLWSQADGGEPLWQEEWTLATQPVSVRSGSFKVQLGTFAALPTAADGEWFVGIAVRPGGIGEWRALGGRQRVKDFVYAARTTRSPDSLAVDGDLTGASLRMTSPGNEVTAGAANFRNGVQSQQTLSVAGHLAVASLTANNVVAPFFLVGETTVNTVTVRDVFTVDVAQASRAGGLETGGDIDARRIDSISMHGVPALRPDVPGNDGTRLLVGDPRRVTGFDEFRLIVDTAGPAPDELQSYSGNSGGFYASGDVGGGEFSMPTGALSVDGTATVNALHVPNCRICLQFTGTGDFHVCTAMHLFGSRSGFAGSGRAWGPDTQVQLGIDCTSGQSVAAAGRIF